MRRVEQSVSFDKPARVHVFETTIRCAPSPSTACRPANCFSAQVGLFFLLESALTHVPTCRAVHACRALGGLLAAHAAAAARPGLVPRYAGSLLEKARDLGARLLPAFDTPTGLPASHVHLQRGVDPADDAHTCTACATTLSLEFAALSEATGDPRYAAAARRAVRAVYRRRSGLTGLVGNTLHTATGAWERPDAGVGAGADSYWEYLLKMYLFSGASEDLAMFVDQYAAVQRELRLESADGAGAVPWLVTAHMHSSKVLRSAWLSSLAAFWPGMQARRPLAAQFVDKTTTCAFISAVAVHSMSRGVPCRQWWARSGTRSGCRRASWARSSGWAGCRSASLPPWTRRGPRHRRRVRLPERRRRRFTFCAITLARRRFPVKLSVVGWCRAAPTLPKS